MACTVAGSEDIPISVDEIEAVTCPLAPTVGFSPVDGNDSREHLGDCYDILDATSIPDADKKAGSLHYDPDKVYGYSRAMVKYVATGIAGALKPEEACIARYVAAKVRNSRNIRQGRRWFWESAKNLSGRIFPWIPHKTLSTILKRMTIKGTIVRGNFNRRPGDWTFWYSMDQAIMDKVEKDILYFRLGDAVEYGLTEAVLIRNLEFHLKQMDANGRRREWHVMSPTFLSKSLGLTLSCVKRALKGLTSSGVLACRRNASERCSEFQFGHRRADLVSGLAVQSRVAPSESCIRTSEDFRNEGCLELIATNAQVLKDLPEDAFFGVIEACESVVSRCVSFLSDEELVSRLNSRSPDALLAAITGRLNVATLPAREAGLVLEIYLHAVGDSRWNLPSCATLLFRTAYTLRLEVCRRTQTWSLEQKRSRYALLLERYASPDASEEQDVRLAPAEKRRILRNAITSRNRVGLFQELGEPKRDHLVANPNDLAAVERFFARNREWSPSHFVRLLDACAELGESDDPDTDETPVARRGNRLGVLLARLDPILQQLGLTGEFPSFEMPSEDCRDGA